MLSTLITHELKNIFFSPKFPLTFVVVTILVLLSVVVGIDQFTNATRQYETTTQLVQQEMREARGWMALNNKILRKPDPMQIFVSGVNNDIGRMSGVNTMNGIKSPSYFHCLLFFLRTMRSTVKQNGEHYN
jgi:hypothetical protein